MSNTLIGIDLGTTMSLLSYIDIESLGTPEISKTRDGDSLVPSRICFTNERIRVGVKNCSSFGGIVAKEFKRDMGSDEKFSAFGKKYSPVDLSSMVLSKLKEGAEANGLVVKDVVITVPAYFDENRRVATKQAGEMAGLNVVSIINEPTAAALYYALSSGKGVNGKIMVFDLGGGTFDLTIMKMNGAEIDILATGGESRLGGADFDKLIVDMLREKYQNAVGSGEPYEEDDKEEFEIQAEEIKKHLSKEDSYTTKVYGTNGKATLTITREEFENAMQSYLYRIENCIQDLLNEADLDKNDIDNVLLVGGSARIPIIQKQVEESMSKKPITSVDVDEAIAKGAALKAAKIHVEKNPELKGKAAFREVSNIDVKEVATVSFGTITLDGAGGEKINSIIIEKGTKIPCEKYGEYSTVSDGQTQVEVEITTGESNNVSEVTVVDSFVLDLPPGRPAGQPIRITYGYREDQTLKCIAEDLRSGNKKEYTPQKRF